MKQIVSKEKLAGWLKNEIIKSRLIDQVDKDFWLAELASLPIGALKQLFLSIQKANQQFDEYLERALAEDKNKDQLKQIQKFKQRILFDASKLEEGSENINKESELDELLKKIK